jgi:hypothetical protein
MRYLELIFVFVFVFIGVLNVIFRVAASKRKKREQASVTGNLPTEKKKAEALLPGETREYSEYKVEKINAEPADDFTGAAVPGQDAAGLTAGSNIEKPVLTRDVAGGSSPRPVTGQISGSSLLTTETDIKRGQVSTWDKINKLSILKRAVVLSEILGPPKSSV